jgi:hypothetical protein
MAFHPGAESLLAGLVDIVPELAELGEPQALVGHPARAIIDHEYESAGQQQQSDKPEKTADHASPSICRAEKRRQPLTGWQRKFNLISILLPLQSGPPEPGGPG